MTQAVVILAAGASERLGECKALALFAGRSGLERLAEAGAGFGDVAPLVIAGAHFEALLEALPAHCEIALNPHWADGRTSGIALARKLRAGFDLCIAPVDCPLVSREVFDNLAAAWREHARPAEGWLAPYVEEHGARRFGHPLVIGRELAQRVDTLEKNAPLRALRAQANPLLGVRCTDLAILDDLDTPADLVRLRARFAHD